MSHTVTAQIYDLQANLLADISDIALEKTFRRRLNQARQFSIQAPSGDSRLTAVMADDGLPNLAEGCRRLVVWEDGTPGTDPPIFHGRINGIEWVGDGTKNLVTLTGLGPVLTELGYDPDRAGRPVRSSSVKGGTYDGNFINPKFASSVDGGNAISGPDLIKQILTNSQNTGSESDPSPGEGPLPIDLNSGTFDLDVPPAVNLNPVDSMNWPVLCGDYIQMLIATGVVDFDEIPVNPGDGLNLDGDPDPYIMVALTAVSRLGSDLSGSIHFDYWTGSFNAGTCRLVADFSTINNKLYDYLGPRLTTNRWRGNITPGSPGTLIDPTASRALYGGQWQSIRAFDTIGTEATSRPLYIALWNAEQGLRVIPRRMLFITPAQDTKGLFEAPSAFDVGDLVAVNTGAEFGVELAEAQRVYGYDKSWNREGVASISELLTSAVAE